MTFFNVDLEPVCILFDTVLLFVFEDIYLFSLSMTIRR